SIEVSAGQLSGGNQQKLLLAKVMLTDPAVVIIDEPTRGIDIGNKGQIYEFIDKLVRSGRACIVISSELQELVGSADRVLVIRAGRHSAELTRREITARDLAYATTSSQARAALTGADPPSSVRGDNHEKGADSTDDS